MTSQNESTPEMNISVQSIINAFENGGKIYFAKILMNASDKNISLRDSLLEDFYDNLIDENCVYDVVDYLEEVCDEDLKMVSILSNFFFQSEVDYSVNNGIDHEKKEKKLNRS